jgi:hypothetical protein
MNKQRISRENASPPERRLDIVVRLAAVGNNVEAWIAAIIWEGVDTIVRLRRRNGGDDD